MKMLCVLFLTLGMIAIAAISAKSEATTTIKPVTRIEYHCPIIEEWVKAYVMRLKYAQAKTQEKKHGSQTIPDAEQASPNPEVQKWRQRKREHHSPSGRTARGFSSAFRQPHVRGNYHLAYTGTPYQGKVFETANGYVPHGECL
jgi:hypothetical protein